MQSNTTFNMHIAKRFFYVACLNNYMFRSLYRPSLGCTLSYYKANYTIYNVFVFVNEISFTSIKFAFKIITVAVELKSYPNVKGINNIKSWMLWSQWGAVGGGAGMVSNWGYSCLAIFPIFLHKHYSYYWYAHGETDACASI